MLIIIGFLEIVVANKHLRFVTYVFGIANLTLLICEAELISQVLVKFPAQISQIFIAQMFRALWHKIALTCRPQKY
ncbi:hypothetical protein VNO77_04332 [Canavalia gladiata]|uniref:Uncharacterized protein n=1 Tax=Canavalia gladiata TaxID=3824 RepID=A0AAN9R8Z0_CANGL